MFIRTLANVFVRGASRCGFPTQSIVNAAELQHVYSSLKLPSQNVRTRKAMSTNASLADEEK